MTSISTGDVTTTDVNGNFTLNISVGNKTLEFSKNGVSTYQTLPREIKVVAAGNDLGEIPLMAPTLDTTVVLSWQSAVLDLDLTVRTPSTAVINSAAPSTTEDVRLDLVNGVGTFGPEIVTIDDTISVSVLTGTYEFFVENVTGAATENLSNSGAVLDIYTPAGVYSQSLYVPENSGNNDYWNAFTVNYANILMPGVTVVDTFSASLP